jgi:hypothetical protein
MAWPGTSTFKRALTNVIATISAASAQRRGVREASNTTDTPPPSARCTIQKTHQYGPHSTSSIAGAWLTGFQSAMENSANSKTKYTHSPTSVTRRSMRMAPSCSASLSSERVKRWTSSSVAAPAVMAEVRKIIGSNALCQ